MAYSDFDLKKFDIRLAYRLLSSQTSLRMLPW